jgi:hypothetical protein
MSVTATSPFSGVVAEFYSSSAAVVARRVVPSQSTTHARGGRDKKR